MKNPRIVALVPMRHHSQRVAGKNYRLLAGKPLYFHIIQALLQCTEIDEIVVDTDSGIIVDGLRASFPSVTILIVRNTCWRHVRLASR
jgi:CMP-N-acetylneuraminic acid synthetase